MATNLDGAPDRSVGELFAELSRETTTLVRQELDLAKTEMTHKAAKAAKNIGFLAAGGAVLYAGFLVILAAIVLALVAAHVAPWVAALIVGIVVLAIGGVFVMNGLKHLRSDELAPKETLQSVKETAQWAKQQTH